MNKTISLNNGISIYDVVSEVINMGGLRDRFLFDCVIDFQVKGMAYLELELVFQEILFNALAEQRTGKIVISLTNSDTCKELIIVNSGFINYEKILKKLIIEANRGFLYFYNGKHELLDPHNWEIENGEQMTANMVLAMPIRELPFVVNLTCKEEKVGSYGGIGKGLSFIRDSLKKIGATFDLFSQNNRVIALIKFPN